METLVLNASYEPLGFIAWQRAITLLYEGKVQIIETYEDKELRSATITIKMPSVVRFIRWVAARKKQIRFSRENILLRDGSKCQYCGSKVQRTEMTYDHVLPKSQGGKTNWENIVLCCYDCNMRKGGRTPEKAGMKLLRKPSKPEKLPDVVSLTLTYKKGMPSSWKNWLRDVAYWNDQLEEET